MKGDIGGDPNWLLEISEKTLIGFSPLPVQKWLLLCSREPQIWTFPIYFSSCSLVLPVSVYFTTHHFWRTTRGGLSLGHQCILKGKSGNIAVSFLEWRRWCCSQLFFSQERTCNPVACRGENMDSSNTFSVRHWSRNSQNPGIHQHWSLHSRTAWTWYFLVIAFQFGNLRIVPAVSPSSQSAELGGLDHHGDFHADPYCPCHWGTYSSWDEFHRWPLFSLEGLVVYCQLYIYIYIWSTYIQCVY